MQLDQSYSPRSKIAAAKAEYVKKAGAEAREDAQKQLKELKAGRTAAKKDLTKLKRASGGAWADLKAGVDKAIAEGRGIEAFRKDFRAIVQKHGWTGWTGLIRLAHTNIKNISILGH